METSDAGRWVMVLGTDGGAVRMEEFPGGKVHRFPAGVLPDDVRPGDSFRVVARLERSGDGTPISPELRRVRHVCEGD